MRATLMYGAGDVRVEDVPDPVVREPADAVVRVLRSCICGSDLWPYRSMPPSEQGQRMGHEFLGAVLECVGLDTAIETALGVVRDGGVVSRVGAPQYAQVPMDYGGEGDTPMATWTSDELTRIGAAEEQQKNCRSRSCGATAPCPAREQSGWSATP